MFIQIVKLYKLSICIDINDFYKPVSFKHFKDAECKMLNIETIIDSLFQRNKRKNDVNCRKVDFFLISYSASNIVIHSLFFTFLRISEQCVQRYILYIFPMGSIR